jgi:hypothetical protein
MRKSIILALVLSQFAIADVVSISSSASWSFTSTGSNGPDSSVATGTGGATMSFNVSLPATAVVSGAWLNMSQSTSISFPGRDCSLLPLPNPVTGFITITNGCSDLIYGKGRFPDAFFLDMFNVDASGPGFISANMAGLPLSIAPDLVPVSGTVSVDLFSSASMEFISWGDMSNRGLTPGIQTFTSDSSASGTLQIEYTVTSDALPEPASYSWLLAGTLAGLISTKVYRRRSSAKRDS